MHRYLLVLLLCSGHALSMEFHDGHIHYNQDVWPQLSAQQALAILDDNGVQRAIVSSTPAAGTQQLYRLAKHRIVPFLRPYRHFRDRFTWHSDAQIIDYLEQQLSQGNYRGLGEFHLFKAHKNTPVVRQIMQLAQRYQLVLSAHADAETVESLLQQHNQLNIIWAHCGMDHPIDEIRRLLNRYNKLSCELSFRSGITNQQGQLQDDWKTLFTDFPQRFILGTDTYTPRRWANFPELSLDTEHWLQQLDPVLAQQIKTHTFDQLFPTK